MHVKSSTANSKMPLSNFKDVQRTKKCTKQLGELFQREDSNPNFKKKPSPHQEVTAKQSTAGNRPKNFVLCLIYDKYRIILVLEKSTHINNYVAQ